MYRCLGIVNVEDDRVQIGELTNYRTIPAVSFLGRYRVIDFILSNMVNSGMDQIKVLVKDKPRSLIEHLGSGTQYDINSKHGNLQILYTDNKITNELYLTDVGLLKQYETFIDECNADYVVIAPSYMICRINYQDVIEHHVNSGAEVTVVYKTVEDADKRFLSCREIEFEGDRVKVIKTSHGSIARKHISLQAYVCKKEKFLQIIDEAIDQSPLYTLENYLAYNVDKIDIRAYQYTGYLFCVNSLEDYFNESLRLIKYENAKELFDPDWPVYTNSNDSPTAFFSPNAKVKNCLIANGCVVQGELENCILGRDVKIKPGAKIKNSLILPSAVVGENVVVENAIIDKHARVEHVKEVKNEGKIAYVRRRDIV